MNKRSTASTPANQPGSRARAILALVATAVLWSTGGLFIKLISWHPVAIAGARSIIAALFLLAVIKRPKFTWSVPQIGGAIAYAGTVILFVLSNKMTTAANAILLQYTAPIYVALFGAWLLKERTKPADWVTIFFVFGGITMFFLDDLSPGNLYGNILALISGVTFAGIALFMRAQKNASPLESALLGNILTACIGIPFMFGPAPDGKSLLGIVLLGVFQLGLSYFLYAYAMKHVTALEGVLIPILEPILNPIWVFLAMGEAPGIWSLVGGIVVLTTIAIRSIRSVHQPSADADGQEPSVQL